MADCRHDIGTVTDVTDLEDDVVSSHYMNYLSGEQKSIVRLQPKAPNDEENEKRRDTISQLR
jgi:hypothetical protein